MRKTILLLTVCALLVMGLAAPVGADPGARPFKGSLTGEVTFTPVGDDICPPDNPLFFGNLRTDSSATGTVSHLGKTEMTSEHCTPAGESITGGEMTLFAANGDQVEIEYYGSAPFPIPGVTEVIVVESFFDIVGGTGRFADADGGGEMTTYVVFEGFGDPVWPATWVWKGQIIGY